MPSTVDVGALAQATLFMGEIFKSFLAPSTCLRKLKHNLRLYSVTFRRFRFVFRGYWDVLCPACHFLIPSCRLFVRLPASDWQFAIDRFSDRWFSKTHPEVETHDWWCIAWGGNSEDYNHTKLCNIWTCQTVEYRQKTSLFLPDRSL